ncbi:MAG: excinuclease ABC subunit UvrB [Clostridia bacterium]|nr:excinuclease ABC subunit UvrB [Clostridia bacterium]
MEERKFELVSKYKPTGDQPQAIEKLVEGVKDGYREQVLLGVTGSGKTFTMANVIAKLNRPALVLAHNKTLAAQLCNEFKEFFPHNRVEYFVSYYDYYQPEAYIPSSDTYIEKDLALNDEIDKLRHSATCSLMERRDTIVVASVSCIYGLGNPETYYNMGLSLRVGQVVDMRKIISKLISMHYSRNDMDFVRSCFRLKGDTLDIFPSYSSEIAVRVEFFGDEIETISEFDPVTNRKINHLEHFLLFPATHFGVEAENLSNALENIKADAVIAEEEFTKQGKLIEAQRIRERVAHDVEMIQEMGYCTGIENYSRYFDGRQPGEAPYVLLDYFPDDFITFIDESHITIPQIRGMYNGDVARKKNLVDYGFRLEAAYDNRPLKFDEFDARVGQMICVSATPAEYELKHAGQVVEQIIRPTGLLDPPVEIRPTKGQIDDLMGEIFKVVETKGRVLITTLTKRMAEDLTTFFQEHDIKVKYLHSEIDTLERIEIINSLRAGEFDVLVGINLLREGIDLPEVKLVAILDADKEGFLRSETSLVQIIGRAARNSEARVIMYADNKTESMDKAITETERRRNIQMQYNKEHNIVPKTIVKEIKNTIEITKKVKEDKTKMTDKELRTEMERIKGLMHVASKNLEFEKAIELREQLNELRKLMRGGKE